MVSCWKTQAFTSGGDSAAARDLSRWPTSPDVPSCVCQKFKCSDGKEEQKKKTDKQEAAEREAFVGRGWPLLGNVPVQGTERSPRQLKIAPQSHPRSETVSVSTTKPPETQKAGTICQRCCGALATGHRRTERQQTVGKQTGRRQQVRLGGYLESVGWFLI